MVLTYGTSVGGWRELLAERVQRVPIRALLKQNKCKMRGEQRRPGGVCAPASVPRVCTLALQGHCEEMNPGGWRNWAFRASWCLHRGVLGKSAVCPPPQAGLHNKFSSLALNSGLQGTGVCQRSAAPQKSRSSGMFFS